MTYARPPRVGCPHPLPGPVTAAGDACRRVSMCVKDTSAGAQRARGHDAYAQDGGRLALQAAQVDAQWTRFAATCQPAAPRDGDRDWFALAEREIAFNLRDRNCPNWLSDMQRMSRDFAAVIRQAGEAARRAGVYPGTLRDLRRQHRRDWTGFER